MLGVVSFLFRCLAFFFCLALLCVSHRLRHAERRSSHRSPPRVPSRCHRYARRNVEHHMLKCSSSYFQSILRILGHARVARGARNFGRLALITCYRLALISSLSSVCVLSFPFLLAIVAQTILAQAIVVRTRHCCGVFRLSFQPYLLRCLERPSCRST